MGDESSLGMVHVITGPGKGKTTSAFGLAMRAAGHGLRVYVIQFMKTGATSGEVLAAGSLPNVEVAQYGTGKFLTRGEMPEAEVTAARRALEHAERVARDGSCDLLVLDEVNVAVSFGLVSEDAVLELLRSKKPGTEVVLTGRDAPDSFMKAADYVMLIQNVKHPHDQDGAARKGIEW